MSSRPKLYIMCGLAFAGKSTLARKIAEHTNSKLIAFDKLWVEKEKERPISKDAKGWRFIRKVARDEILRSLKEGISVVYDDTNVRFEHREELRKLVKESGFDSTVIYLNTPLKVIKAREQTNRVTRERHEVEPKNFQTVLEQLEVPTAYEKALEFTPETDLDDFLRRIL